MFKGRMLFLTPNQQHQSTESICTEGYRQFRQYLKARLFMLLRTREQSNFSAPHKQEQQD